MVQFVQFDLFAGKQPAAILERGATMEEKTEMRIPGPNDPDYEGPDFLWMTEQEEKKPAKRLYDDCAWAKEPDKIPEDQIAETLETEVLIVGGGIAGLAAGARCTDLGLKCIVIEKYHGIVSRGAHIACVDSPVMRKLGVSIDKKQFARDWMHICGSRVNEDLLWLYLNNCSDAVQWLVDLGGDAVELKLFGGRYRGPDFTEYDGTHYLIQKPEATRYKNYAGARLMCEILQDHCLEGEGNQIIRKTKAQYLEKDDSGRVVSCIAQGEDGKYRRFRGTRAVVLATGDIGSNKDMMRTFAPIGLVPKVNFYFPQVPDPDNPGHRTGLNQGDGHRMAYWMGAKFETPSWALSMHPQAYAFFVFFFLFVNRDGKRFMNEDTWVQAKSIRCAMQPRGDYAFTIFDKKWFDELGDLADITGGQFVGPMMMDYGEKWSRANGIDKAIEQYVERGFCFKADTLDELADKMGVPKDTFLATVARYNELAEKGEDEDFGKLPWHLSKIVKPPFRGFWMGACLLTTEQGILINEKAQAVDDSSEPIEGLFVTGDCSGGFFVNNYPCLMAGIAMGRTMTFAIKAVKVAFGEE